ncbi:MAG: VOC family protein [Spirochaetaceae bacterium]|nr:MAG: VOC family protein [Spirochaetaceae bacterium]
MNEIIISGIQQLGVGIPDTDEAFRWFRAVFGTDVPVFREAAEAPFMTRYTGGTVHSRDAMLAMNLAGGGGFEIWQYTSREPQAPKKPVEIGDYGIIAGRIKARGIHQAYQRLQAQGVTILGPVAGDPEGVLRFSLRDPWGNHYQVVDGAEWFSKPRHNTGGVEGALIGVSDMASALDFYATVLGYDSKRYDESGLFPDLAVLPGGNRSLRRVVLERSAGHQGAFSELFGATRLELVEVPGHKGSPLFKNRYWGDLGFIHLCFDVLGMDILKTRCQAAGHPFTVDSGESFDMGEAGGRFAYIEDPDGTLIEFVETHKLPLVKKFKWQLDLRKRDAARPLPRWMIAAMGMGRVKK